jgi:hypothetical protein
MGRAPSTLCIADWTGLRAGLDVVEKRKFPLLLSEIERCFLDRPARSIVAIRTEITRIALLNRSSS